MLLEKLVTLAISAKLTNEFTSREESEEHDWERILSLYIKKFAETC